ncbi:MAG: hypothetical protein K6G55_01435 [Selenomonadaceae bacterium]|nr:hypothetical protein [Selenomonadaceae bacterium]
MDILQFNVGEKVATLYTTAQENKPLIVLNNYSGDGGNVVEIMKKFDCPECNLLSVGNLNWDDDMTPWRCPSIFPTDNPCNGKADDYLKILIGEILPMAKEKINGEPRKIGIAGYSLAGLFALYSMYQCDAFDVVASMSGSLWYPKFKDYCLSHEMKKMPEKIYLSLGDKEAKTKNPFLKTVQENTESLVDYYRKLNLVVTWELNKGNHFKDEVLRTVKGIKAILTEDE